MSSNFRHYREAASRVEQGWLQNDYFRGGQICMVGGVLKAIKADRTELPADMVEEMDRHLIRYPAYRILRTFTLERGMPLQKAIEGWNDLPWRRKKSVIAALSTLAEEQEVQWLRDERSRLIIEVTNLRSQVATLQQRVQQLEKDKEHLLKRLANYHTLKTSRHQLATLSDELDAKWEELQRLPADALAKT